MPIDAAALCACQVRGLKAALEAKTIEADDLRTDLKLAEQELEETYALAAATAAAMMLVLQRARRRDGRHDDIFLTAAAIAMAAAMAAFLAARGFGCSGRESLHRRR